MRRMAVFIAAASSLLLLSPTMAASAPPPADLRAAWTWEQLAAVPGADPAHVKLLRSAPEADAREAVRLAAGLSSQESAQVVASLMSLDGWAFLPEKLGPFRAFAARFGERPPPRGNAAIVRNAALALELRQAVKGLTSSFYMHEFRGRPFEVKAVSGGPYDWTFQLETEPAKRMLGLLASPVTSDAAYRSLGGPAFEAMYQHRSQDFYPAPMTRERLAMAFALASGDDPVVRYYRFANPLGLLDLNDVAMHRARYEEIVRTLDLRSAELVQTVQAMIDPYIPAGTKFERTVYLMFGDGADGWASSEIAGLDLEYFKDDYPRLINLLAHETYHVAQDAARRKDTLPSKAGAGSAAGIFHRGMDALFHEGTASLIFPPSEQDEADRGKIIATGVDLLQRLSKTDDAREAQNLVNEGTRGGGPFYFVGAEMSRMIVADGGAKALAGTLKCGGLCFFDAYVKAVRRQPKEKMLFTADFVKRVRALR